MHNKKVKFTPVLCISAGTPSFALLFPYLKRYAPQIDRL